MCSHAGQLVVFLRPPPALMSKSLDPDVQKRLDTFLDGKGLRRTKQREVIIKAALTTHEHFTADELWEMARKLDRTTSRATLYRTLSLLVESGLLREIDLGRDQTVYDPNFIDSPNHNHLICLDCQKVVEFDDPHISLLEDCITRRLGFSPASKSVRIEASCEELRKHGTCKSRRVEAVH
jgi:Fur family transcriptional regulator, ferric uptake regulator